MAVTVAKWGNSLAVRIPRELAQAIEVSEGSAVELAVVDGTLVITPQKPKRYSLEELVANITPENRHEAVFDDAPMGNEVW
jgi:antitoxin MazE